MDYSNKGILVMLQDLQRKYFGRMTMLVNVYILDESDPMVNGCVFDKDGEPHNFNFYAGDSDERHKDEYITLLRLVHETAA